MYLCCVESLNSFRSSLDFLRFFKVTPKSGQSPCTYSTVILAKFRQKSKVENSPFLYFFFMHIHVLMLRRKFELIAIKFRFFTIF